MEKNWNDNKLNESLYNCLNIENTINSIYELNQKTEKNNFKYLYLKFSFHEENFIKDISKIINENLNYSKIIYNFLNDSNILTAQKDKEKMLDFLNKKFKSFELIYRGTRDGDSAKNFHQKCDNRGPTLTLCKEKDGKIFGGYTEANWDSDNRHEKSDKEAFIFSITNNKKIKTKNNENSIECNKDYGPVFGFGGDLTIVDNFLEKGSNMWTEQKTYFDKKYEITNGERCFVLEELEVYLIQF